MPFGWVRDIRQQGAWGTPLVRLELRASRMAATGYGLVVLAIAALLGWPLAVAGSALAADNLALAAPLGIDGILKLAAVTALTVAGLVWFAYCTYRSVIGCGEVVVAERMVTVTEPRLFGTRTTRTPLTSFEGLAILPRTTLGERGSGLFLLHPDRRLSPLLMAASAIDAQNARVISSALGVPLVASLDGTHGNVFAIDPSGGLEQPRAA